MNKKILIIILVFALMPTTALAAPPKPTQAQIDAAKKIEAEKKAAAWESYQQLSAEDKKLLAQKRAQTTKPSAVTSPTLK